MSIDSHVLVAGMGLALLLWSGWAAAAVMSEQKHALYYLAIPINAAIGMGLWMLWMFGPGLCRG